MFARPAAPIVFGVLLSIGLVGCADARCDPNPVGAPWKKYESLLPDKAVVCGPNRLSSKKESDVVDHYPPTQVFVYYEDKNPAGAFRATIEKFEKAGWQPSFDEPIGEGKTAIYGANVTKDGTRIRI